MAYFGVDSIMDELKRQVSSEELDRFEASTINVTAEPTTRLCAEKICKLAQEHMTTPVSDFFRSLPAVFFRNEYLQINCLCFATIGLLYLYIIKVNGGISPFHQAAFRLAYLFPLCHMAWHKPSLKWMCYSMVIFTLAREGRRQMRVFLQRRGGGRARPV